MTWIADNDITTLGRAIMYEEPYFTNLSADVSNLGEVEMGRTQYCKARVPRHSLRAATHCNVKFRRFRAHFHMDESVNDKARAQTHLMTFLLIESERIHLASDGMERPGWRHFK